MVAKFPLPIFLVQFVNPLLVGFYNLLDDVHELAKDHGQLCFPLICEALKL